MRIWAGWKPALPVTLPVVLPVVIMLAGWLFRTSTASLPSAREMALSLRLSHVFLHVVCYKVKMLQKPLNSYLKRRPVLKIRKR